MVVGFSLVPEDGCRTSDLRERSTNRTGSVRKSNVSGSVVNKTLERSLGLGPDGSIRQGVKDLEPLSLY